MRLIVNEFDADYSSYRFGYTVQAIAEDDALHEMYAQGFLPQSNEIAIADELYYLARSVRIDTAHFSPSSENRRVQRKAEDLELQYELWDKKTFLQHEADFLPFAWDYVEQRIGSQYMPPDRLKYIIQRACFTHALVVYQAGRVLAYVLLGKDAKATHYWFSFFDVALMASFPLGKWLMYYVIQDAQRDGIPYVYLGTCYKKKALYKIRDFKAVEFFDGSRWSSDMQELKRRCALDESEN